MRECGEEILVDISEILFNELAFYKLMQQLDSANPPRHQLMSSAVGLYRSAATRSNTNTTVSTTATQSENDGDNSAVNSTSNSVGNTGRENKLL